MNRIRKHIRLRNFDYSSEGAYFITFSTKYRIRYFGELKNGNIILSEIGTIADEYINKITDHFPQAELDEYCIMPDHIHCILFLIGKPLGYQVGHRHFIPPLYPLINPKSPEKGPRLIGPKTDKEDTKETALRINQFSKPVSGSISVIIQQFKAAVKRECNKRGLSFHWHGRFHESVIRTEADYQRIKNYIKKNPENG